MIENMTEGWAGHTGQEVEDFIKEQLTSAITGSRDKIGWIDYTAGRVTFYDEQGGTPLGSFSLTGTVYAIDLECDTPTSFYILTSATSRPVTVRPTTQSGTIGGSMTEYAEDYTYTFAVDNGSGVFVERASGSCRGGESLVEDIRGWVTVGANRIRVTVTGVSSRQSRSLVFSCVVTSLTLRSEFAWWRPFVEGSTYAIDGLFFSGNLQKTLYVRIDDDPEQTYTLTFSSGTNYVTTPYSLDLSSRFPAGGTGIHKVEVWMAGDGVETQHYAYRIMCVAKDDANKVSLVCVNEVAGKAVNYDTQTLFAYATYNATQVTFDIGATDGLRDYTVADGQTITVQTQTRQIYATKLEIDTEASEGLTLSVVAAVSGNSEQLTMPVDNSNSYAAVSGARFYTNAALRSNGAADRTEILNIAPGADKTSYAAQWQGFAWSVDGWAADSDGNRCLCVNAGSSVIVPDLKPLAATGASSLTLEVKFRCANIADYDTPVLSFMSEETYNEATTSGVIIFPTKILVLTSGNRQVVPQSVNLTEDRVTHAVIVLQRGYGNTGRNLCHIYVNGVRQAVFEYGGNVSFGNGCLRMGQPSADLYLYMLRYYVGRAFEYSDVLTNFLNTIVDDAEYTREGVRKDNRIIDGTEISYELCKAAGYNCMVIEMPGDIDIPSVTNNVKANSSVTFEYNDHPEWNVRIDNAPIDGQGTTSMRYYRWNVRWKLKDAALFTYADGTTDTKEGYIAGKGLHPKVAKITAKKNYASSTQGHKMGACGMYDELYERVGLKASLPSADNRVATYQYPFMGFQKYTDGTYKFIGLYTAGPDKGDKKTFGYDYKAYPDLLQLEGPNHAPLATRFLHPWVDVEYSADDETLTFGGQEGWDVSACRYETDNPADAANILALMEREWKPAYEIVYNCSPYLCSLAEAGYVSLDALNADADNFRRQGGIISNRTNEVLQLYDDEYNLIYYRNKTGRYEVLDGFDMIAYLGSYLTNKTNPSTAELIAARAAKFTAEAGNYWSVDDATYHDCFCVFTGATDNHTKNTYPFKFKPLAEGGRWCWKEDDLDSILPTDNNGQSTKSYSIEPGDVTADGVDIYQGSSSAFWTLIRTCFAAGCKTMMTRMVGAMEALAGELGIQGAYVHRTVFNVFDHFFWSHSARYFPATAYNEDAAFSYLTPWAADPNKTYNNVYPLTQALGTQYEAERQWVERRIAYVFSLYEVAAFTGSGDDGYGRIEFTPAAPFDFHITPAIDMYPSGNLGGGQNIKGVRTPAGEECIIPASSDGQTTFYLKALDWYTSIGDLCGLTLTSRGGDATVGASLSIKSKRLRSVKVGDADASKVSFNASTLAVSGESVEVIDARNVPSLRNDVSLLGCPRLKRALFEGTNVPTLLIPVGAKIEEVSFPSGLQTLFLHTLPLLTMSGLRIPDDALTTINGIYYQECPGITPFEILRKVFNAGGNVLQFITMIWTTPIDGTADDLDMLAAFAGNSYNPDTGLGYGSVAYDAERNILTNTAQKPALEGVINIDGYAYEDSADALRAFFGANLTINVLKGYYIRFADDAVRRICAEIWGDGTGITREMAAQVKTINSEFSGRTDLVSFDEFRYFTAFTGNGNCLRHSGLSRVIFPAGELIFNLAVKKTGEIDYIKIMPGKKVTRADLGDSDKNIHVKLIYIPECTAFHDYFFRGVKIDKLYLHCSTPPSIHLGYGSNINGVTEFYVPLGCGDAYQANVARTNGYLEYDFDADPDGVIPTL